MMFDCQDPLSNNWTSTDKNLSILLNQALKDPHRQEHGLAVVFDTKDKHPNFKDWQLHAKEGQEESDIKELYNKRTDYTAYSYFTGIGGLIDIDFDWEWLYNEAEKVFGDRLDTRTLRTPNGGYRVLFITGNPEDCLQYKNQPPHIEIHGKKTHHIIVYGQVLNEKGTMGNYEVVKDFQIRQDSKIIPDFIKFVNGVMEKCSFLQYHCIKSILNRKQVALNQEQRTNIGAFFVAEEIDMGLATEFFRCTDDFNPKTTRDHLVRLKNKDFKHPTCEKLRKNFNWEKSDCIGCIRKYHKFYDEQSESEGAEDFSLKTNLTTEIVEAIQKDTKILIDNRGIPHARFKVQNHFEIWPVRSKRFKGLLYRKGKFLHKNKIPASETITNAQKYLEALSFDSEENKLNNRVCSANGAFWYDLSNKEWQAVKITGDSWEIVDNPPALFRREQHQKTQIYPSSHGINNIWKFFDFVNVPENKKLLLLVYMVSCFIPDIPHPVIIIYGEPGSGKSILMEFLRDIIDPSQVPKLKIPKGDKDIVQNFDHHYAPFFDNLDTIQPWLSDMICRAVTGEGSEHRALYTDSDSVIRNYRRCIGLTGINVAARKGDLLDRSILIGLDQMSQENRKEETQLRSNYNENLPEILGGIFTVMTKAMDLYPSVKLENLPRMADFAKWGYAIAEAIGGYGDEFITAYAKDEEDRIMEALDANPLSTAIISLMDDLTEWKGTPTELLITLENVAEEEKINIKSKNWPKSPTWATRRLNEIKSGLNTLGIKIEKKRDGQKRTIAILKPDKNDVSAGSTVTQSDNDMNDTNDSKNHHLTDWMN